LVYIGYGLSDLRTANYTMADLSNSNLVYSAAELKTAGYTAKNFKDAGYTINTLISLGFSVTEIRAAGFTPDQVISLGGYTLDSLFRTGIYDYSDLVPYGYYIPGCIFDISSTLWNTIITNTSPISVWPASRIYPVMNTGGSFTDLSFETVPCLSTGKTNIIIKWSSFTKKSQYDGFIMLSVSYHNNASINIKQFENIPLANVYISSGNVFTGCFSSFSGVITATDTPLLVNTNYDLCFAYSPNTSLNSSRLSIGYADTVTPSDVSAGLRVLFGE
jgi:hypothetical protein